MLGLATSALLSWPATAGAAARTHISDSQFLHAPPVLAGERAAWLSRDGDAILAWDGRRMRTLHRLPAEPPGSNTAEYRLAASPSRIAVARLSYGAGDKVVDTTGELVQVLMRGSRQPLTLRSCADSNCTCAVEPAVWGTVVALADTDCGPTTITVYETRGGTPRRRAVVRTGYAVTFG